ncbi:MAG: hypothetical protein JSU87_12170 [Gemmatimonadota bacterium]|nr:MAG: hypothetical protein JSU87_12170 [Gemmatimonadota bacterium]
MITLIRSILQPAAALTLLVACQSANEPYAPAVETDTVLSVDVVAQLDTARTYEHRFGSVAPESVLVALWQDELPVSRAWWPLDYACLDPIGPRLTVELDRADSRILDRDFVKGTGRLACATSLRQYRLSRFPLGQPLWAD